MCMACGASSGSETDSHPPVPLNRRLLLGGLGGAALMGLAGCASAERPRDAAAVADADQAIGDAKFGLVLLGTQAGPPVVADRAGISSALVVDGQVYVVDCGRSAVTQYLRAGLKFRQLNSIFITHLHADHIADYYNFFLLAGHIPNMSGDNLPGAITVHGPGPAGGLPPKFGGGGAPTVAPEGPAPGIVEVTDRLHAAHAYSSNVFLRDMDIRDIRDLARVREIELPDVGADHRNTAPPMRPFLVVEDDRVRVTATLVPHGPVFPSFAFRFDTEHGSVTFSGDTERTPNLIELAAGTDLLVHEAIGVRGADLSPAVRDHMLQSHVEVQEVGEVAQAAQARKLVLSHIADMARETIDEEAWRNWAQQGYEGEVVIGKDLQAFVLA